MRVVAITAVLALFIAPQSRAAVLGFESEEIDFTRGKAPAGVTWSKNMTLRAKGLQSPAYKKNAIHEIWLQTNKLPVGQAWRPPRGAKMWLSVVGVGEGRSHPDVFVRYGVDGVHWSTWYQLQPSEQPKDGALWTFEVHLQLPSLIVRRYDELMKGWVETDPNFVSDEDAYCRWLAKTHPDYFATEIPFLGWVQFRIEQRSSERPVRIEKLKAEFSWATGGLHMAPKDGKYPEPSKWHFDLSAKP